MANLLRNTRTLLANPRVARDYAQYWGSKLRNGGVPVRRFPDSIRIAGLSGFSEFHASGRFVSPAEWAFFRSQPIGPGALIDVGANLGVVSAILARRFPDRSVHAFEPNPSAFEALEANAALNDLDNLHPHRSALADRPGQLPFLADPVDRGTNRLASADDPCSIVVPATTLDAFADEHEIDSVAFLKLDVEGFETLVLRGAERLLSRHQIGLIYYEVCPAMTLDAGFDPLGPTTLLRSLGYRIARLDADGRTLDVEDLAIESIELDNWVALAP